MKSNPRILLSVGTRPEIIKMAPIYLELKQRGVAPLWLHTGQHDEMAQELYRLWQITPDYNIVLRRNVETVRSCDLASLSALLLEKTSSVLLEADPDVVMVHGDTSSALVMALAAFYQKRRIAHVESGLRSGNEYHPFPEEKNRMLIAQLAHMHFAPTIRAKKNLLAEGIAKSTIHMVGNTIVQATKLGAAMLNDASVKPMNVHAVNIQSPEKRLIMHVVNTTYIGVANLSKVTKKSTIVDTLAHQIEGKSLLLVTAHRRENHDEGIANIARAVLELIKMNDDMIVVWPMHPNPKVQAKIKQIFSGLSIELLTRLHLTESLAYPTLLWILKHAWMVLTDSGGIQEEAVALRVPVLVLRETTERPEVIETGAGLLVGTDTNNIVHTVSELTKYSKRYQKMRASKNPFGDDLVAKRICDIILKE
jgi:UDP-N-acetylglucosamine 2-epimerase